MILLLQTVEFNGWIDLLQKLGFPIFVALGLLWFLFKVWQYVTKKIDEKDTVITNQIDQSNTFRTNMLKTQDDIGNTLKAHKNILADIKDFMKR